MLRNKFLPTPESDPTQQTSLVSVPNTWMNRTTNSMAGAFSDSFSQFVCSICRETDEKPKILTCLHTICRRCSDNINPASTAGSAAIVCPICPADDNNHHMPLDLLSFLVDVPSRNDEYVNGIDGIDSSSLRKYCRSCNEGNPVVAKCRDCDDVLCKNCVQAHHRVRLTKDHCIDKFVGDSMPQFNAFQSLTFSPTSYAITPRNENYCSVHKDEVLGFFCDSCRVFICTLCRYSDHVKHSVLYIKEAVNKYQNQSLGLLAEAQTNLKNIEESILQIEQMREKIDIRCNSIKNEIHSVAARFVNIVEERERDMIVNVDKIRQLKGKSLLLQAEERRRTLIALKKTYENLKLSVETANELEVLNINDQAIALIQDILQTQNYQKPHEDDTIAYSPPNGSMLSAIQSIGHLSSTAFAPNCVVVGLGLKRAMVNRVSTFVIHAKDHLGEPRKCGMDNPIVVIHSPNNTVLTVDVLDRSNGTYSVSYKPTVNGEHVITITIRGLEVSHSPFTVPIFYPRDLSTLCDVYSNFGKKGEANGELRRPWGVCCDKDGHVIVADRSNNRIQFFTLKGKYLHQFGSAGSLPGEFNLPAGVAVDSDGRIIVADKDNHRIQIFTSSGQFIHKFGERGNEDGQFKYPWDVATNSRREILVCDSRNHRLQLFSPEGRFLKKYGYVGNQWKNFDSPRGVCFGQNDEILVTDFNNHRILVISPDFQMARCLGMEGTGDGQFRRPQGIAVDAEGHIIVADSRNNRIQIFQPNGTFLHSVGSLGSDIGQLNCPSGICVSPEGYIVVVDFENTRIQVF